MSNSTTPLETLSKSHRHRELSDLVRGLHATVQQEEHRVHRPPMLKAALQGAVGLEFSTLPPYLTALWSIRDRRCDVANSIREILQEEMLHMALACNMLVGIGGVPEIKGAVPRYPGKLPMNVHPELTVGLSGLNDDVVRAFMEIERPAHQSHFAALGAEDELVRAEASDHDPEQEDYTIGEFYNALLIAFREEDPPFTTDHQITGPLAWFVVKDLDGVERAIDVIETQGEGSEGSPDAAVDSLAHYFRFAEVLERKKLEKDPDTGKWDFRTPIDFDMESDVIPVGPAPEGGYNPESMPDLEAQRLLHRFNGTYSRLVDLLDTAWKSEDGQAQLWHGIDTMFELEKYALPLMQIPRPDGMHYGPDFRYLPESERAFKA